jgi:hypothetical protein
MSKKKLLSEAQVRRFMGLAGINPLNEMAYKQDDMQEEELYEQEDPEMDDMDMGEDPDMKGSEMDEPEAQVEEDMLMSAIEGQRQALETLESIASDAGLDVGGMGDAPDMPDPDMPELEGGEEDEEPADMPELEGGEEDEDMEKELQEVDMQLSEEEIVNEVARRVAKRIVEAKRAHKKMNEALGRKTTTRRRRR